MGSLKSQRGQLYDSSTTPDIGSECVFNVYEAALVWDGNFLTIAIDEDDSEPLVGISLMENYQLIIQVFESGHVELSKVARV